MRNSRSSLMAAAALSLAAVAGLGGSAVAPSIAYPAPEPGRAGGEAGARSSPNGGRNRKGRTVKADQRRALKRRNKARA